MAYILVVDDDDIVAEHAAQVLLDAGYAAGHVGDAEAALEVMRRKTPDLLLLDQNMPGLSGANLLRKMRGSEKFYDIPVVMFTGVQGIREEQIAYYNGAQDYIRKPFSPNMLLFRVKQVLRSREARARLGGRARIATMPYEKRSPAQSERPSPPLRLV